MRQVSRLILFVSLGIAGIAGAAVYRAHHSDPYFFSRTKQYSGDLYSDWEGDIFFPNGAKETWTIQESSGELRGHLFPEPGDNKNVSWGAAALVVEGKLSRSGSFGHLGVAKRELKIIRVIHSEPVKLPFNTKAVQFKQAQ
jgi:hypothetical protein